MRTLSFKVWLVTAFFCASFPRALDEHTVQVDTVCINRATGAFMDGQRRIYHMPSNDFEDGDCATLTIQNDVVITAEKGGMIWRYDNNGTFTQVSYPWHFEGNRPAVVHTEVR